MSNEKIDQFEIMQETIRVLQEHRNNALDKLVGAETNNRFLVRKIGELRESNEKSLAGKNTIDLSSESNTVNECKEENKKLAEVVDKLRVSNVELESTNQQLKEKLSLLQNTKILSSNSRLESRNKNSSQNFDSNAKGN